MAKQFQPGDLFTDTKGDSYRVRRVLGEGGMAVVYEVDHPRTAIRYAVKVAKIPEGCAPALRNELIRCFNREREMMERVWHLRHPHIATLIDAGTTAGGEPYIILEYLDGETVAERLKRQGALPWPEAHAIALQMGDALAAVHSLTIVHRDLSLRNVFLCSSRRSDSLYVKLLDFGVAKYAGHTIHPGLYGSPPYMAPEQASERAVIDERADQFALASCLIEMLTGKPPFARESEDVKQILTRVQTEDVGALIQGLDVPASVRSSLARALKKEPDQRFPSIEDFVEELRRAGPAGEAVHTPAAPSPDGPYPVAAVNSLPAAPFGQWFYIAIGAAVMLCGALAVLLPRWLTSPVEPAAPPVPPVRPAPAAARPDLGSAPRPIPDMAAPRQDLAVAQDLAAAASPGAVATPPAALLGASSEPAAPAVVKKPRRPKPAVTLTLGVVFPAYATVPPSADAAARKSIQACFMKAAGKLPSSGLLDGSRPLQRSDFKLTSKNGPVGAAVTAALERCLTAAFVGTTAAPISVRLFWSPKT